MSKIKKTLFIFIILSFVTTAFFGDAIISSVVEYSFKSYCRNCLSASVKSEKIKRGDHFIVFENLRLNSNNDPHVAFLISEELKIDYNLHFFKREIDLYITLENPSLDLDLMAPSIHKFFEEKTSDFRLFKINHQLSIKNGILKVPVEGIYQEIDFTSEHDFIEANELKLTASFNRSNDEYSAFKLNAWKDQPGVLVVDVSFQDLCCKTMQKIFSLVVPDFNKFTVYDGNLNGNATLVFKDGEKPEIISDIILDELSCIYNPLNIALNIPKSHLVFSERKNGRLDISEGSFLMKQQGLDVLSFHKLSGSCFLMCDDACKIVLEGKADLDLLGFDVRIDAEKNLHSFNLALKLNSKENQNAQFDFSSEDDLAEIKFKNFGPTEFHLAQTLLKDVSDNFLLINLNDGLLDAEFKLKVKDSKIEKFNLSKFAGKNVKVDFNPLKLGFEADTLLGTFDADLLLDHFFEFFNANIYIDNGSLKLENHQTPLFTEIKTDLNIENGVAKKSVINGKFLGLDGKIHVDFLNDNQLMALAFVGEANQLISLLGQDKRELFEKSFKSDCLSLQGDLKKLIDANTLKNIFSFEGSLNVISKLPVCCESILFGFEIEDQSEADEDSSFVLQNGWFKASDLKLEKYLSPFIFTEDEIKLTGTGNFQGLFTPSEIHVSYDGKDVSLENEHFVMETKNLEGGKHLIDLDNDKILGTIPIVQGTYFQKNNGLLFTDIQANFEVEDKKIKAPFMEAFCNGVYCSGSQELDLSSPNKGEFDLSFQVSNMKGKFSQLQSIFSHFNKPFFFLKIPMESDVSLRKNGAILNFHFKPDDYLLYAKVQGDISSGNLASDYFDVSVQDLNVNFDYDHGSSILSLSDIQGTLLVGKPERVEEYSLSGDHIHFTDYSNNESSFDVWIGDKNRDIMRFVGKTKSTDSSNELIQISLNHDLSHFGDMYPRNFTCVLKDWTEVDTLNVELKFSLRAIFNDLQRFSRTGFFFLSRGLLKELNEIKKAKGDFLVNLDYDKTKSIFNYQLSGSNTEIGAYQFDTVFLKGTKRSHIWSIEELKLDKLSLSADISHHENGCKINFLGIQMGTSLLAGLEGEYKKQENAFFTKVNLFEANLDHLKEWLSLKALVDEYNPKGNFKGFGQLKIELGKGPSGIQADLLLNGSLTKFQAKGVNFKDMEGISCHFLSDRSLILRSIKTAINTESLETSNQVALFDIDKLEYDFRNHAFSVEGLNFKLPAINLEPFAFLLKTSFKDIFNEYALNHLKNLKTSGFFEGSLNMDISNPYYALRLMLKDGDYQFLNQDHTVKNFIVDFDPCEFKLTTEYIFKNRPMVLTLDSKSPTLEFGKLKVSDSSLTTSEEDASLMIYWRNHKDMGLAIETAEGFFSGIHTQLYRNPEAPIEPGKFHLTGEINVDVKDLRGLIPEEFQERLKTLQMGSGYALKGDWSLFNGKDFDLADSRFKGQLIGNDFEFKGYQFQSLLADVDYRKHDIVFNQLHLEDPCGTLHADKLHIFCQNEDSWKVQFSLMQIHDFRPGLIKRAGSLLTLSKKPLAITEWDLENVEGDLLDFASFKGYGRISFKNPHKKNLQNTILAIPAEIISRIGLDPTVLTPVIGTIEYQILDGKILLTKFKDVFSEGRLSRFYLASTPYPSYVDFDGNLFLKVRMKQFNLLFKLAEPFIVSVEGNLRKPTYTLQKQSKHEPHEPNTLTDDT
jgi:hypothetical protein